MDLDDELNPTSLALPVCGRPIGLGMTAHQLSNTLVPILALGALLADSLQQAETSPDLDLIVASASRARALVSIIVAEINRLEGGTTVRESAVVLPFDSQMPL